MSHDGHTMVTPNSNTNDSTQLDLIPGVIAAKTPVGFLPIATGMMPDASKYYVSNCVDSSITCISIGAPRCKDGSINLPTKTIGLLLGGTTVGNYDPIAGTGFATSSGLPIQTRVSPNGKYMVTAATLTGTITIVDTTTDTLVKVLPCSAGCRDRRGLGFIRLVLAFIDQEEDQLGAASHEVFGGGLNRTPSGAPVSTPLVLVPRLSGRPGT